MEPLVLKFKDSNNEFAFGNKVHLIEDKKLIQNIERPNYKNGDSLILIKSLNDLHISEVVQIKVNLSDTGTFLANFQKDVLTEEKREELLKQISTLKKEEESTPETQLNKTKELLKIIGNFQPIYVSFVNSGSIKITLNDFSIKNLKFPLLVLKKPNRIVLNLNFKKKTEKQKKEYAPIELFNVDYFFIFLFAMFGALGIITSIFEIMNKQGIGIFLVILSVAFILTELVAMSLTIYDKGKEKHPLLRYYLIIFILIGIVAGTVAGYFISKGLLKTEIEDFDYKKLILLSSIISSVTLLSSVGLSIPGNIIIQKIQKKKKD